MDAVLALLGFVVVAGLAAGVVALMRSPRVMPPIAVADAAELDALGRELLREHHERIAARLGRLVETIKSRRVPLTRVDPDPGIRGQGILVFADGSALLARSARPGDLGIVAVASLVERVLLTASADNGRQFTIRLTWGADGRDLEAVAVADSFSG